MERRIPIAVLALISLVALWVIVKFLRLWIWARITNVGISFFDLINMRFLKVDPKPVVLSKILLQKCGCPEIANEDLISHAIVGGRVMAVAEAFVKARRDGVEVDWKALCAIDREGRNVAEYVERLARR
jgi:uncharacterized protein YqfA (UPF0365 family)